MDTGNGIRLLLLDIGGVLLSNGWDHNMRRAAADQFGLDYEEMNDRHHLTFDTYEEGKTSLQVYLRRVVFHKPRDFTMEPFRQHMFAQSRPHPEMIEMLREAARRNRLRVGAVSNEGRELSDYRISTFHLAEFVEFFVCSCYVHFRKPDEDMYRIALDIAHTRPERAVYIDDRAMFAEVARGMGIHGIHHTSLETTREALSGLGLSVPEPSRAP